MRNLKRALSLALSSVMLLGMMVVGTSAASYPDVDANDNLEAIQVLQILGVMSGDEKGNFNPDAKITRNEMAVIMTHLLNLSEGGKTPFTDVPAWAQPYVGAIYNAGVTSGTSATTYGGSSNVTAVEAALMVMKALGYFGFQGEFGDNWTVSVVKQATKIGLFDGVDAASTAAITRSEAAQICLNALESTVTVVTQTGGGSIVTGDTNVNLTASYSYEDVKNTKYDYASNAKDEVQQLCEKLYGQELKKKGTDSDKFGRVATKWTYKGEEVISANAADATYTAAVEYKTIYKDLGLSNDKLKADVYVDGNEEADVKDIVLKNNEKKVGGNGVLVEAYKNTDDNGAVTSVTITVINTYTSKVDDIDTNKDDERIVYLADGETFKTEAFEVDDVVLYTKANGDVQSMALATVVEDVEVTRTTGSTSFVADGTTYKYTENFDGTNKTNVASTVSAKDGLNLYIDAYGYVVNTDTYKSGSDYAYVIDYATEGNWSSSKTHYARLLLADGTVSEVKVKDDAKNLQNHVVTYTVNSKDVYTLKNVATADKTTGALDINKGEAAMKIGGKTYYANSKTLFLLQKGEGDDATYTAYTGIANVPNLTGNNIYAAVDASAGSVAKVVYLKDASASTETNELVYVLLDGAKKSYDSEIGAFYTYDAVVNGKITTIDFVYDKKGATLPTANGDATGTVAIYKSVGYNSDKLADASQSTAYDKDTSKDQYLVKGTASKVKDGTIFIGNEGYTAAEGMKIYEVTDEISTVSQSKVATHEVTAVVVNGEVTAIFWAH